MKANNVLVLSHPFKTNLRKFLPSIKNFISQNENVCEQALPWLIHI